MSWLACVQRLGRTVLLLRPGEAFLPHRDTVAAQSRDSPSFRGKGAAFAPEQAHDEGPGSSIVHSVQRVALLLRPASAWVPAIIDANSGDVASSNIVRLRAMHASQSDMSHDGHPACKAWRPAMLASYHSAWMCQPQWTHAYFRHVRYASRHSEQWSCSLSQHNT